MNLLAVALAALVGLFLGGLINLLLYRLPRQRPLFRRPHCTRCGHPLGWEALPLVGYLLQRGECRHCHRPIPRFFPLVELLTTAAFALLTARLSVRDGGGLFLVGLYAFFALSLILTLFLDWQYHDIYYIILIPTTAVALLGHWLHPRLNEQQSLLGLAVGVAFFALLFFFGQIIFRDQALGLGDVWLAGMIGAMLGLPGAALALAGGMLLAGLSAGLLLLLRRKSTGSYIPYGSYLCMATLTYLCLWAP